ncbi:MAG TPA: response regulator [Flavisolibacter sp.]|nr:response regulator [Flavisolibacter sp.]
MPKKGPILIIEDDFDDQELLKEVFEDLNIVNEIKFFESCISVLEYLVTAIAKPFLIISDINLPLMTGLELKARINETECIRKKNIPFIFFTTNPGHTVVAEAFEMNAQGYFVKPSTLDGIKEVIRKIVDYWGTGLLPQQV